MVSAMPKHLVLYSRTNPCPYLSIAYEVLKKHQVAYTEILIDRDPVALDNVLRWTGFLSIPTLVVAEEDSVLPYQQPAFLARGTSPRGINRGSMITEPNKYELEMWLFEHEFIEGF
jgi:glutaredoxin